MQKHLCALTFAWNNKTAQDVSGSNPAKLIFLPRFHNEANAKDSRMRLVICQKREGVFDHDIKT